MNHTVRRSFRWGIIGCGLIAPRFVEQLRKTGEGDVVAAASKSMRRARKLRDATGISAVYDSYEEMLRSESLDAVYIATTHNAHRRNALLCFRYGRPVLVEKPITRNAAEAEQILGSARDTGLFCMEAMWTRFNPSSHAVKALIDDGAIGSVQHFRAAFCVKMKWRSRKMMPWNRMINPFLAGGALLDIGVYPISYARMIFGCPPSAIEAAAAMLWTGVDKTAQIHFTYPDGARADMIASFRETRPRVAVITGTDGEIRIAHFSGAEKLQLTRAGCAPETISCGEPGFVHEIREVHRCLREGRIESPLMPHAESLETMRVMDAVRGQWGMKYPGE